jgi:DNA-binding NtrC family response regulator
VITKDLLPELESPRARAAPPTEKLNRSRWESERQAIQKALQKAQGNREVTARFLGISRICGPLAQVANRTLLGFRGISG